MASLTKLENAVRLIITHKLTPVNLKNAKNEKVINFIYDELDKDIHIPYDYIAKTVYGTQNVDSIEDDEWLNRNIHLLISNYQGNSKNKLVSNLRKIENNYKLSVIQKEYITSITRQVSKSVDNLENRTDVAILKSTKTQQQLEDIKSSLKDIESTKSGIYTDFIAILGVFSAFVFLMFGGVDVLKSVFDVTDNLETVSLKRLVVIGSMMIITLLTLMYSLLLWVSRITHKDFGQKCFHKDCTEECGHKICHCFYRHSFYFGLFGIFSGIIVLANWLLK